MLSPACHLAPRVLLFASALPFGFAVWPCRLALPFGLCSDLPWHITLLGPWQHFKLEVLTCNWQRLKREVPQPLLSGIRSSPIGHNLCYLPAGAFHQPSGGRTLSPKFLAMHLQPEPRRTARAMRLRQPCDCWPAEGYAPKPCGGGGASCAILAHSRISPRARQGARTRARAPGAGTTSAVEPETKLLEQEDITKLLDQKKKRKKRRRNMAHGTWEDWNP